MPFLLIASAVTTLLLGPRAQERQGSVSTVVTSAADVNGTVQFTVRGTNPCGSLEVDFGDGTRVATYPIRQFPVTIAHDYPKVGTFSARIAGAGYCGGSVTTRVRVARVAPQPWSAPTVTDPQTSGSIRFAGMDRNNDGVISRAEWRGSAQSFAVHDWNRDGRLSGEEVRTGATWPADRSTNVETTFRAWTREQFTTLDRNGDGRVTRFEWGRFDIEDFIRADRNGDNQLALNEFLIAADVDDDRGDRFEYLDLDGNNRLDRTEWHGTASAFQ
jgi:Ca2+-binding EF-hand superfamily protein